MLKKGDFVTVRNRLYAIVDEKGRILKDDWDMMAIFSTRRQAVAQFDMWIKDGAYKVARLDDISYTVI